MSTGVSPISFSGLGSGIDTAGIVDALMAVERQPIVRIEQDKAELTAQQGVVQELNVQLQTLRDAAAKLYDIGALADKSAVSSETTVATATADSTATAGAYNVTVTALAQSHTLASTASPTLTTGETLDVTVGGDTKSVTVEAGDTLQTFADRINGTDGIDASASVINDKLVLISKTSGAAGAVTVAGSAAPAFGMTTTQTGQDAAATINGLAITGAGNTIENAINGVTLELASTGSTTLTVADDTAKIEGTVKTFVDAYNALNSNINAATAYDVDSGSSGTLQGDQTITSIRSQLRNIAGSAVGGLAGNKYDSLAQIGITTSQDGTLTLDSADFAAAVTDDPDAVRNVFGYTNGDSTIDGTDGIARQLRELANTLSTETLAQRLTGIGDQLTRMDDKIDNLEELMVLKEERLRRQFQAMELAILQFQSQGADLTARFAAGNS